MPGIPKGYVDDKGRECTKCGEYKLWDQFYKRVKGVNGHKSACRICAKASVADRRRTSANYYQKNKSEILKQKRSKHCPIAMKNYKLIKRYGITLDDFSIMYKEQNGECKICNKKLLKFATSKTKQATACVDHCHKTGRVRGLLCNNCNQALGLLRDNHELLQSAIRYLRA